MAASNDFSEKAASHKSQTNNAQIPQPQDNSSNVVLKLNPVHGKLTLSKNQPNCAVPKTFPPKNFNSSSRFPISRTWHRNSSVTATEPKVQPKTARTTNTSYIRKGNSLVRIGHVDDPALLGTERVNESTHAMPINYREKSLNSIARALEETLKTSAVPECQVGTVRHRALEEQISGKKITYFKKSLYQLVAASDFEDLSVLGNTQASSSDGYYKKRKNQLVRLSLGNHIKEGANGNTYKLGSPAILLRSSNKRRSGFAKTYRSSKFSFVWKLHEAKSLGKPKNLIGPQKVWPYLFPWKRSTYRRNFVHALGSKPNISSFSTASQKLLFSRKRGAIYTGSTHGYSLRMSKVLSVGGSSLKWSKSIERNSKKANEEATLAFAEAAQKKKEGKDVIPIALKSRNHVSRKWVLSLKLRPGRPLCNPGVAFQIHTAYASVKRNKEVVVDYDRERIFWIRSERYKMDPTRRTLHRITAEEEPSSSVPQSEKNVKRSYVPRRLLIGNDEYVRIGNGNQLVRDPKKRTRVLASEKVKWSLRLARKRKYCHNKNDRDFTRGRYFDGGPIGDADCSVATTEKLSSKGKDDIIFTEGNFPDYISLDVRDEEQNTIWP